MSAYFEPFRAIRFCSVSSINKTLHRMKEEAAEYPIQEGSWHDLTTYCASRLETLNSAFRVCSSPSAGSDGDGLGTIGALSKNGVEGAA